MGHKIHNIVGLHVIGFELHAGLRAAPIPFVPTPFAFEINFLHPFIMGPNQAPTVQINGVNAVKDGHAPKCLWPHLPIPISDNILFPLDLVFGEQKCWIPRLGVWIEGTPSAITVTPSEISFNLECWFFGKIPTNLVLQFGTVETTPTSADFSYGLIRAAVDLAVDVVFTALTGGFTPGTSAAGTSYRQVFLRNFLGRLLPMPGDTNSQSFWSGFSWAAGKAGFQPGQFAADAVANQAGWTTPTSSSPFSAVDTPPSIGSIASGFFPPLAAAGGIIEGFGGENPYD